MSGRVDVFIPTLNSQRTVEDSLRSLIYAGVPVNQILLVDGFSTDYTVQAVKRFCEYMGWGFKVMYTKGDLGLARHLGNLMAETPLYVSLDSDVLLPAGWYVKVRADMEDPALIYSGSYLIYGDEGTTTHRCWSFYCREKNTQPSTGSTLFRRSLVDFRCMVGIRISEDTIYNFHVLEAGGRYKLRHDIPARHPSTALRDLKHSYGWGGGARAIGRHGLVEICRVVRAAYKGIKAAAQLRDVKLAVYMPLRETIHLLGFIRGHRIARQHGFREELNLILAARRMVKAKRLF